MEIILIAFLAACGYLIILAKTIGLHNTVRTQVLWDALFTLGMPWLMAGSYQGLVTAILAGVFFSVAIFFIGLATRPFFNLQKKESA